MSWFLISGTPLHLFCFTYFFVYRKLINSGVGVDNGHNGAEGVRSGYAEKKKMPRFTKTVHEALVEIFKKIGQKNLTKVGLQELYNFKVEHPHVDLEPFLAQSSQYLRDYIEKGLKKIKEEVKVGSAPPQIIPESSSCSSFTKVDPNSCGYSSGIGEFISRLRDFLICCYQVMGIATSSTQPAPARTVTTIIRCVKQSSD